MCGILGVVHSPKVSRKLLEPLCGFIGDGLYTGVLRGQDSTGMFQIDKDGDAAHFKLPYSGNIFAKHDEAQMMVRAVDQDPITIVHHRAATRGNVTAANAHPFEYSSKDRYVIGVHNGHVNHSRNEDGRTFHVDSDWAYYQIFKHGAKKAIANMDGAMVLVWYEEDGKVRIFANGRRPIYWAYMKDTDAMLISSEHGMLWWLTERRSIELDVDVMYPTDELIYTFDPNDPRAYTTEKLEPKPQIVVSESKVIANRALHNAVIGAQGSTRLAAFQELPNRPLETWQGLFVSYHSERVEQFGVSLYQEIEFFINKFQEFNTINIVGEVAYNKKEDKEPEVAYAVMLNVHPNTSENLKWVEESDTQIMVRVIGATNVRIDGKIWPALVVAEPRIMTKLGIIDDIKEETPSPEAKIRGPNGKLITELEFKLLAADGCAYCTTPVTVVDAMNGDIDWAPGDVKAAPICVECQVAVAQADEYHASAHMKAISRE